MIWSIRDATDREWADADSLQNATFGARTLAEEERSEFVVVDPAGKEVAWSRVAENGQIVSYSLQKANGRQAR
jgi:hypothetical protein